MYIDIYVYELIKAEERNESDKLSQIYICIFIYIYMHIYKKQKIKRVVQFISAF